MSQLPENANGGVNSISEIISRMNDARVRVITQYETPKNNKLRANGIEVLVWPDIASGGFLARRLSTIVLNLRMLRHLVANRYDNIHFNDNKALLGGILSAKLTQHHTTLNVRDTQPEGKPYGLIWKLAALVNTIIALSREMATELQKKLPLTKLGNYSLEWVYSVVDSKSPKSHSLKKQHTDGRSIVAIVAKISPKKQQLKLLNFLNDHPNYLNDLVVYFIGDFDPHTDSYSRRCYELVRGSARLRASIKFWGYQDEMARFYTAADVVLVPSEREGLARCMIEALGFGTPVVSFDVCSAHEILETNDCGIVVEQGNYHGLMSGVKELLTSPGMLDEFSKRGRETALRLFAPHKIVARYEEIFFGHD